MSRLVSSRLQPSRHFGHACTPSVLAAARIGAPAALRCPACRASSLPVCPACRASSLPPHHRVQHLVHLDERRLRNHVWHKHGNPHCLGEQLQSTASPLLCGQKAAGGGLSLRAGSPGWRQPASPTIQARKTAPLLLLTHPSTHLPTLLPQGAAALLWSAKPTATYLEIKNALFNNADQVVDKTKVQNGRRLNVARALNALLGLPAPTMPKYTSESSFAPRVSRVCSFPARAAKPQWPLR